MLLKNFVNELWFQQVAEVARETNELLDLLSAEGKERIRRSEWFYVASWTFLTRDIQFRDNILIFVDFQTRYWQLILRFYSENKRYLTKNVDIEHALTTFSCFSTSKL